MSQRTQRQALPDSWFQRDCTTVARELVGCRMYLRPETAYHEPLILRIVETEAYLAENDLACHAATRLTARNKTMFEPGGVLYVYRIYGIHYCSNIVMEAAGRGAAVLLRGAEVVSGVERVRAARPGVDDHALLKGPGNFCRGLSIDRRLDGISCCSDVLQIYPAEDGVDVRVSTRIGITQSVDLPLRFFDAASRSVSAHRRSIPA